MKRSIKLTVKRISCLIMVCALLVNSYPIQTVAADMEAQTTSETQDAVDNQSASDGGNESKEETPAQPDADNRGDLGNVSADKAEADNSDTDNTPTKGDGTTEKKTESATEVTTEDPTEVTTEDPTEVTTEDPTEITTEDPTEITTEDPTETTTEETTIVVRQEISNVEMQVSSVEINEIKPVYKSGKSGNVGCFEAEAGGNATLHLNVERTTVEEVVKKPKADSTEQKEATDTPQSSTEDPAEDPVSENCKIILKAEYPNGKMIDLGSKEVTVTEGQDETISISGNKKLKMDASGEYTIWINVLDKEGNEIEKTSRSVSITIPDKLTSNIAISKFTASEYTQITENGICTGFEVPYTLTVTAHVDGMGDTVKASERSSEIAASIPELNYIIKVNGWKKAEGKFDKNSIVSRIQANAESGKGAECEETIEGTFKISRAGTFAITADVDGCKEPAQEELTIDKLDRNIKYSSDKTEYIFGETAVFTPDENSVCTGKADITVTDKDGNVNRNATVKYNEQNGSFEVNMDNSKEDSTETVKITVVFPADTIYKENIYDKCTVTFKRTNTDIKYMISPVSEDGYYNYGQGITVYADVFQNNSKFDIKKLSAVEVDENNIEVKDDKKQLTISIDKYNKNIKIENANKANTEDSTAYIRLDYAGDAYHNPKSTIISIKFRKQDQNLKYTADEDIVHVFGQDTVTIINESEYTIGTVTYYESDQKGNEVAEAEKKLTITKNGKNGYQVTAPNVVNADNTWEDEATYYITFVHEGSKSYKRAEGTVTLKFSRIDNTIAYKASSSEESHEYGEEIIFTRESGAVAGGVMCYESDEAGNKLDADEHVHISDEKNGKISVTGIKLTDEPCYITIEHKENNTYRTSNKVTFRFDVCKIASQGSITLNEETKGILFFKTKQLVLKITMATSRNIPFQNDAENINFKLTLKGNDKDKVLKNNRSGYKYDKNTCTATYTYAIDKEDVYALKAAEYELTATADLKEYYEPFEKIFDSIHVEQSKLDIKLDPKQVKDGVFTVEFNNDVRTLNCKILGEINENENNLTAGMKITSADPETFEINDDGSFRTLKGGTTTITLVADDNTDYDIYEPCEKTITVVITDPQNVSYTLNGQNPEKYLSKATKVAGTENWFDEEICFEAGVDNLYGEIRYSIDGGKSYKTVKGRSFTIRNTEIQNYTFYFCDEEKNISSKNLEGNAGYGEIKNIAVDTAAPVWNSKLSVDKKASEHSTDSISYFPEEVTLTAHTGDMPGSKERVDLASGVDKVEVYYIDRNETKVIDIPLDDRYKDAYDLVLSDNDIYGRIRFTAVDYLGHRSEAAEYNKSICVDKVVPVIGYKILNNSGNQISYNGEWTNQQLQYILELLTGTQVSGIYSYQYKFAAAGSKANLSDDTGWISISEKELRLVFGTVLNRTQNSSDGTMQYADSAKESKVVTDIAGYARMNGTLYFKAESNAGLTTGTEDIEKNSSRIRLWQQDLNTANVAATVAPDSSTGWYNKQTGPVSINFAYPEYDAKNYAPAAGIVYKFETTDAIGNPGTSDTYSFYRGILDEESGEVLEVTDYHDAGSKSGLPVINIDKDSISKISIYAEDAAGNCSDITNYEIKADFIAPDQITATADGADMPVHLDASEGISYRVFSKSSISMSGQAQYGISEKKSFSMALTKEQGGVSGSGAGTDSISIDPCNRGLVYICAIDGAGNKSEAWTDGVVSDNMIPTGDTSQEITITPKGKNEAEFYNKDVEVSVHVVDAPNNDNYAGLKNVTYTVGKDGSATQADVSMYSNEASVLSLDQIKSSQKYSDDKLIINAAQNESNHAYIAVTATDHAGNTVTTTKELKIDVTKPEIEISFDTDAAQNERYYNTNRVARIDIKELNFDPNQVTFRIYKDGAEDPSLTPAASSWSGDENSITHTAYITFAEDGDYSFEVECTDLAGNDSEIAKTDTFTIDKTKPVVEVSYDNNQAWKENYYNQARTATISITEHNFDEKDFEASITPQASIGGWTHNGDIHKVTIHFSQDEHYTYSVNYTDLAGNTIDTFTPEEFYIDSNAPTIEINGVADHSANAGDVKPTVTVADNNYDVEGVKITLQNSKGQQIDLDRSQTGGESGYTYALTNVNEQPDEIYTLAVVATDKAGNESDLSYRFSLNRHGSVYDLSQISSLVDRAYIRFEDLEDLHIQEMNVSEVNDFEVYVTRNGEMIQSKQQNGRPSSKDKNTIYVGTQVNGSDEIGYEYDYTLYRESFQQEGIYNIMFYSKDAAGNEVNNTLTEKKAELTFIIDNTAPTVVIEGVEDGQLYIEESKDVNVYVSDNFKLTEAYFKLVDEDGNVVETYNYMDMAKEAGDIVTLTLPSSDKKQSLRYYAADAAGNSIITLEDENAATGFTISTNAWLRYTNDKRAIAATIATAAAVIMAGIGIVIFKKKKIGNKPAAAK